MHADPTPLSSLERRLARLERREHRWRIATTVATGLLGVVVLSGSVWKAEPSLDVRELRLIDDKGRARLLLTLADTGHPKMLMVDADGRIRAQYTSELLAFEDRGTPRVRLGGENGLQLFDTLGQKQASLWTGTGGSFLSLHNLPGRGFARLGIDKDGVKYATQSSSAVPDQAAPR